MAQLDPSVQQLFDLSPAQQEEFAMGMELGQTPEAQMQVAQLLPQFMQKQEDPLSNLFKMDLGGATKQKVETKKAVTKKTTTKLPAKLPTKLPPKVAAPVAQPTPTPPVAVAPMPLPEIPSVESTFKMPDALINIADKQFTNPETEVPWYRSLYEDYPNAELAMKQFAQMQPPSMKAQREQLAELQKMIMGQKAPIPKENIAWLMGLSDILTDSDTLSKYKTPEMLKYEQGQAKIKNIGELSKLQGDLTKEERELLETQNLIELKARLGFGGMGQKGDAAEAKEQGLMTRQQKEHEFQLEKQARELENRLKLRQMINAAKAAKGPARNKATEILEKEFITKYYGAWKLGGKYGGYLKNINNLKGSIATIRANSDKFGLDRYRMVPSGMLDKVMPKELIAAKKRAIDAIASTIKQRGVDSQFAAKEAEQIWSRAFDPVLSAEENASNLEQEMKMLEVENDEINRTGKYFEEHGLSLQGFAGSAESYGEAAPKQKAAPAAAPSAAPKGGDAKMNRIMELLSKGKK